MIFIIKTSRIFKCSFSFSLQDFLEFLSSLNQKLGIAIWFQMYEIVIFGTSSLQEAIWVYFA